MARSDVVNEHIREAGQQLRGGHQRVDQPLLRRETFELLDSARLVQLELAAGGAAPEGTV